MAIQHTHTNNDFIHNDKSFNNKLAKKNISKQLLKDNINPNDPMLVLSYLMILVSAAVVVTTGQFPWFVSMLAVGLLMSVLFPIRKSIYKRYL